MTPCTVAIIDPIRRPEGMKPHACAGTILRLARSLKAARQYAATEIGHDREWAVVRLREFEVYRAGQPLTPDQIIQFNQLSSATRARIKGEK